MIYLPRSQAHDFEADALLVVPQGVGEDIPDIKTRVSVVVSLAPKWMWNAKPQLAQEGEAVFDMQVVEDTIRSIDHPVSGHVWKEPQQHVNNGGYWTTLSRLNRNGAVTYEDNTDWLIRLPRDTREAMLVWWDEHASEIEDEEDDENGTTDKDVERALRQADLPVRRQPSGNADWSVAAWGLGNNLYLIQPDADDFALIRRDMDSEEDEIEEIVDGSLEYCVLAAQILRNGGIAVSYDDGLSIGPASPALAVASLRAEPTGAVLAYESAEGVWLPCPEPQADQMRRVGERLFTVYVRAA